MARGLIFGNAKRHTLTHTHTKKIIYEYTHTESHRPARTAPTDRRGHFIILKKSKLSMDKNYYGFHSFFDLSYQ